MHTFDGGFTIFHYNSDLSGDVVLTDSDGEKSFTVPACELLALFAEWMKRQAETALDNRLISEVRGILK
jgi:hypothetical protein